MDPEKDPMQSFPDQQSAPALLSKLSQFLSTQEAIDIFKQFQSDEWFHNGQVLWSGVPRHRAQEWADYHQLQTLTTAMGPLMDEKHPDCLRFKKTSQQWSRYIHGASAIFAWHIAQGEIVTLLSPPPPKRFHPSGLSYYQVIEEPIIKGLVSRCAVDKIIIAHPTVKKSQNFLYELWPDDKGNEWSQRYGSRPLKTNWRQIGRNMDELRSKILMTVPEQYNQSKAFQVRPLVALIKPTQISLLVVIILILLNKLPLLLLVGLLYSLADKSWDENKTNNHSILRQDEQARFFEGQGAASQAAKDEKKAEAKAQDEARKKLKDKKKAEAKAQEEARKKLKDKKKAEAKAQEEARKKLKDKKKAEAKAQDEARKKLKDKKKAEAKAQDEARKKLKDKKKAEAKAQQEATTKLKGNKKC